MHIEKLESRQLLSVTASTDPSVVLNDSFSGKTVNTSLWHMPAFDPNGSTYLGRTQLAVSDNAPLPKVSKGALHLKLNTFNPTGFSFYGQELISNQTFDIGAGLDIVVRARLKSPKSGIVGGVFGYMVREDGGHDEVDAELVSKRMNEVQSNVYSDEPLGAGHPVFSELPISSKKKPGKLTQYHTYRMLILPNQVEWFIDGTIVRTESTTVPAGPLQIYLNIWAPDTSWAEAYNAKIQPTHSKKKNRGVGMMDVDSVVVTSYGPADVLPIPTPTPTPTPIPTPTPTPSPTFTANDASVTLNAMSVKQGGSLSASGKVTGTGTGTVSYTVFVQKPDGTQSVLKSSTVTMTDGTAAIPAFGLDTSVIGSYQVWIQVTSPGNGFDSDAATYSVTSPTANSPISVTAVDAEATADPVLKGGTVSGDGNVTATGYGTISYYWMVESPDSSTAHKVGSTLTATKPATGDFNIPTFTGLPSNVVGYYHPFVRIVDSVGTDGVHYKLPGGFLDSDHGLMYAVVASTGPGISITYMPNNYGDATTDNFWDEVEGKVTFNPNDYDGLAIYIKVGNGWWTKPQFAYPLTAINDDGTWGNVINTGGHDADGNEIRIFLIPTGFDIPQVGGAANLPDSLSSLFSIDLVRQTFTVPGV